VQDLRKVREHHREAQVTEHTVHEAVCQRGEGCSNIDKYRRGLLRPEARQPHPRVDFDHIREQPHRVRQ
jgi:hypothetical protein